ncbi:winged helix-turn-helix domain-containing protein [Streptomyces sp. Z26]|uniref:ArsR/SmtB family transcription factor n=1 Tax=Streptomyces sp. Z26 TaxID=2500177 RepID=UPI000EF17464|nr:winged helix-turn-helix domain-containing protein [Streptomyces sp. Z26]RLL68733.1 ArsR family transcriptional regulator [Streptomyces sp. Z26]
MLRVHFTAGDLARTNVADAPDPFWESVLSLHRLRRTEADPVLAGWREHVLAHGRSALRLLLPLVPAHGYFPDFLTPAASTDGFEAGLDALLSTPRARLREQLGRLAGAGPPDPWTRTLAEGSGPAVRRLGAALREHRDQALGPSWPQIRARVEQDRARRARTQWYEGTDALLRTFAPAMRWRAPVLEVDYPVDRDLRLEGRGILLIPSYFCRRTPVALADAELPPTLVYPAQGTCARAERAESAPLARDLARLLGHTRAAVLQSLGGDCTTSELARRAGVSVSSASEHAAVLRDAGLIVSDRRRNRVQHSLTPVGLALRAGARELVPPAVRSPAVPPPGT